MEKNESLTRTSKSPLQGSSYYRRKRPRSLVVYPISADLGLEWQESCMQVDFCQLQTTMGIFGSVNPRDLWTVATGHVCLSINFPSKKKVLEMVPLPFQRSFWLIKPACQCLHWQAILPLSHLEVNLASKKSQIIRMYAKEIVGNEVLCDILQMREQR